MQTIYHKRYLPFTLKYIPNSEYLQYKIKSCLTAALIISSFKHCPIDLVTLLTNHPERTNRYFPYISESLLRNVQSNHTLLGCLPLLFRKRQILMRSDIKLPQPFVSWSNSL